MEIHESLDFRNYIEDVIFDNVDEILKKTDGICKCPRCRLDIAAIALNDIHPKYVVSKKGYAYARIEELEAQFRADALVAISKAIKKVKERPRH